MASFSSGCERHPLVRPRGDEHKKARRRGWPLLLLGALAIDPNTSLTAASTTPIKVLNAKRRPADNIPAVRVPLGIPNDYKPWIAKLNSGELLMVAFYSREVSDKEKAAGKSRSERAVFWRSQNGGLTWGEREERADIKGREFALNVLSDGTILMPCHFLKQDVANNAGHTYSKLFRSVDNGRRWKETRIGPKGFPAQAQTATDWTAIEVPDARSLGGKMVLFGVSMQHGRERVPDNVYLWRSRNGGRKWDKSLNPDTAGWIDVDGFFSQSTTYRAASGKLLHAVRVDRTGPHWPLPGAEMIKREAGDQARDISLFCAGNQPRKSALIRTESTVGCWPGCGAVRT